MAVATIQTTAGEIKVEDGVGSISELPPLADGKRNRKVVIKADHLRDPVHGWLDTQNPRLGQLNLSVGMRVAYRIEIHRDRGVGPELPISKVGTRQKVRDLAYLGPPDRPLPPTSVPLDGSAPAVVPPPPAPQPTSNPVQPASSGWDDAPWPPPEPDPWDGWEPFADWSQPAPNNAQPAPNNAQVGPQRPVAAGKPGECGHGLPLVWQGEPVSCPHCLGITSPPAWQNVPQGSSTLPNDHEATVAPSSSAPAEPPASTAPRPASGDEPSAVQRGPRLKEAKAWEMLNSDGSLNPGSYAVASCQDLLEVAYDLTSIRNREIAEQEGRKETMDLAAVEVLGRRLLAAADYAQSRIRPDGRANRMDGSHKRARSAVRTALKAHPIPWNGTPADKQAWLATIKEQAAGLLEISLRSVAGDE